jgi:hypothetical protein
MKGRYLILVTSVLAVVVLFVAYAAYPRLTSTQIATIKANPNTYNGQAMSIFGTVVDRGDNSLTLADSTGTIDVTWSGALPPIGTTNVLVHGIVNGEAVYIGNAFQFSHVEVRATSVGVWPV